MKHYEVCAAVITRKNKENRTEVFCACRAGTKAGSEPKETDYLWEFPGGKIERGETREQSLVREIREEFGAQITANRFILTSLYQYTAFSISLHAFFCTLQRGKLDLREHRESAWLLPELLPLLRWAPADIPIMQSVLGECGESNAADCVSLRLFTNTDMSRFVSWLAQPHVQKWYTPQDAWIDELSRRNTEYAWITHYIIMFQNTAAGFCQWYPFEKGGETWNGTVPADGTYSLDYFVGNPALLRHGIGKRALCKVCALICCFTAARRIIVQPEKANIASQKTLESAGFCYDAHNELFILECAHKDK